MKVPFLKSKIVNLQADSIQYQLHAVLCMRREVVPVQQCNTAGSPCKKGGGDATLNVRNFTHSVK